MKSSITTPYTVCNWRWDTNRSLILTWYRVGCSNGWRLSIVDFYKAGQLIPRCSRSAVINEDLIGTVRFDVITAGKRCVYHARRVRVHIGVIIEALFQ